MLQKLVSYIEFDKMENVALTKTKLPDDTSNICGGFYKALRARRKGFAAVETILKHCRYRLGETVIRQVRQPYK